MRPIRIVQHIVIAALATTAFALYMWSPAAKAATAGPRQPISAAPTPTLEAMNYVPGLMLNYDPSSVLQPVSFPNCRYGAASLSSTQEPWLPLVGAGWYLNFQTTSTAGQEGIDYAPIIKIRQNKEQRVGECAYMSGYTTSPALTEAGLGKAITAHPGVLWIVGNEPDRGPNPDVADDCSASVQDDTYPEVYAQAYHDVYQFIKEHDATARVATAGLVEVTPGRLQYLDKVWQAYLDNYGTTIPVDVWNMHLYILPETEPDGSPNGIANVALGTDPALGIRGSGADPAACGKPNVYCYADHDNMTFFAQQVTDMRTWMKDHGQQNKPLILSEYSLLYPYILDIPGDPSSCYLMDEFGQCFTPERVMTFMTRSFDYLQTATDPSLGYPLDGNRLVQQWLWFSLYYAGAGEPSNLVKSDLTALTQPGQTYRTAVLAQPETVNLLPESTTGAVASGLSLANSTGATVALAVTIRNNGNTSTDAPFTVTFYSDSALQHPIGSTEITQAVGGCATNTVKTQVTWTNLTDGKHQYWVKIDSGQAITESSEGDNVASGIVIANPHRVALPLIVRP